jgi:signal transduction histidine kinase
MLGPLNTLAGRLVFLTVAAIAISYAAAFALFSNERNRAIGRMIETRIVERIVFIAEELRSAEPTRRADLLRTRFDRGLRFSLVAEPSIKSRGSSGAAGRIARSVSRRLNGAQTRAEFHPIEPATVHFSRFRGGDDRGQPPGPEMKLEASGQSFVGRSAPVLPPEAGARIIHYSVEGEEPPQGALRAKTFRTVFFDRPGPPPLEQVLVAVELKPRQWLEITAVMPRPEGLPASFLFAAFGAILLVAVGAAFVARQISRPMADLAAAAGKLAQGATGVRLRAQGPQDVRRASEAFNAMAARLSRQMSRQRQMLWALSHDLRTPITALKLRAELLDDASARQKMLAPLAEMEALTEQALRLARAGASEEEVCRADLSQIAHALAGELNELGLAIAVDAPTPVFTQCRPGEIARAARNLAENAATYAGSGLIAVRREANEAVIEVRDEGCGLAPDIVSRVTEPFFRADEARSKEDGAGLGLAIAQAIADSHGGRLTLENRLPRGLSARLSLPAAT